MRIIEDTKLDFSDVLLVPKHSTIESRNDVILNRMFSFKHSKETWEGIPIISANMESVTTPKVARIMVEHHMMAALPKEKMVIEGGYPEKLQLDSLIETIGVNSLYYKDKWIKFICLDVANGYMEKVVEVVKGLRNETEKCIIVGNVVTPEMVTALILAGADVVKIGIGSGSACATRIKTGVGYPQLSAVIECADAAHGLGGHIISDGGCTCPGDVAKAFAAGADFVMLGGMLAGHTENGIEFYGESSRFAIEKKSGGLRDYRAAEGWEIQLPEKGNLENTLQDILGGLRSTCAYVGAERLKDLPKCATFIKVNNQVNTSLWRYRI